MRIHHASATRRIKKEKRMKRAEQVWKSQQPDNCDHTELIHHIRHPLECKHWSTLHPISDTPWYGCNGQEKSRAYSQAQACCKTACQYEHKSDNQKYRGVLLTVFRIPKRIRSLMTKSMTRHEIRSVNHSLTRLLQKEKGKPPICNIDRISSIMIMLSRSHNALDLGE